MLLTKEERKTLTKPEKKALRKVRRAERRAERQPPRWLKWDVMEPIAKSLMLEAAFLALPGPERMDDVIEDLTDDWDDIIRWEWVERVSSFNPLAATLGKLAAGALEDVDGILLDALADRYLRPQVQILYDEMEAAGMFDRADNGGRPPDPPTPPPGNRMG